MRLAGGGTLHQINNLGKARFLARSLNPRQHHRRQVVAAGNDRVAFRPRHGARFPCQQRFVHRGLTAHHHPICRKSLARPHLDDVAGLQPPDRDPLKLPIGFLAGHTVGQAVHQDFQRASGAVAQAQLKPATGQQEKDKHRQRVEKNFAAKNASRVKGARAADHKGDQHAQRHRQVHADAPVHDVAPGIGKEWAA